MGGVGKENFSQEVGICKGEKGDKGNFVGRGTVTTRVRGKDSRTKPLPLTAAT